MKENLVKDRISFGSFVGMLITCELLLCFIGAVCATDVSSGSGGGGGVNAYVLKWAVCESNTLRLMGLSGGNERSEKERAERSVVADPVSVSASISGLAQCAWMNVTINEKTTSVRAVRVASVERDANGTTVFVSKKAVWTLAGGPGGVSSLNSLTQVWRGVAALGFDAVTLDSSGLGYSSNGDCVSMPNRDALRTEESKSRWLNRTTACLRAMREKGGLQGIERAVDELAGAIKMAGYERNAVVGTSAGSILLRRLLQRYPSSVEWAVFEAIVTKKHDLWGGAERVSVKAMDVFLDRCEEETACAKLFDWYGGVRVAARQLSRLSNRCTDELMENKVGLKEAFMELAYNLGDIKKLIVPTILRFTRCGRKDYEWLQRLYNIWLPALGLGEMVRKPKAPEVARSGRLGFSLDVHFYQAIEVAEGNLSRQKERPIVTRTYVCEESEFACLGENLYQELLVTLNGSIPGNAALHEGADKYNGIAVGFAGDLDIETPLTQAVDWKNDFNKTGRHWFVELKGGEHGVVGPTVKIVNERVQILGPLILAEVLKSNASVPLNESRVREIFGESLMSKYRSLEMAGFFKRMIGMAEEESLFDEEYKGDDWTSDAKPKIGVVEKLFGILIAVGLLGIVLLT